jgi:hypothetical protein
MSSGSERFIQYTKQVAPKELPASPVFKRLRDTGGTGIANNRSNLTSNEIRDDRQIVVSRLGQNQPDVSLAVELSYDSYDDIIQGSLGGEWIGGKTVVANATVTTAGVFSLTGVGDLWVNYNIFVGDYVLINGTSNVNLIGRVGTIVDEDLTVVDVLTGTPIVTTGATADFTFVTGHYAAQLNTASAVVATYNDTPTGASGAVELTATTAGFAGNVTITGNGTDDVASLVAAYNLTVTVEYEVTVDSGGAEIPDNGIEMTLTGGLDADGTLTVSVTGSTITRSAGSWITLGVEIGDKVFFKNFTNAGNNGWKKVASATATVLTIESSSVLVDEVKNDAIVSLTTSTGFLTVGKSLDFFALEEGFTDVSSGEDIDEESVTDGVFHHVLGAYVSSFSANIQPDSIITSEFMFQALTYSGFKNASVATSYMVANTNDVLDSFTGDLYIPNAPEMQSVITGLSFTLDNGLIRRYALMSKDATSIGDGRSTVTGTLNAYFENADISNLFEREQEFAMAIRTEDLSGNSYLFGFPRVKLNSDSRDITENDVTLSVGFAALGGLATDKKKTIYILRQPVIPA